jgi:predicted RNA-binding Zn-ribbon protein involved in translation (DUF1610 family)
MEATKKMVCTECGVEMNRHALKIDYGLASEDTEAFDADFGGVLEEAHACPACGKTLTRMAPQD